MSQAGVGVMISHLFNSEADVSRYYGKVIKAIWIEDDILNIDFEDDVKIQIKDDGQSCCEHRYMVCDDRLDSLVGHKLTGIEIKDAETVDDDYEVHEQQFLEIRTDDGFVTVANHNEHNGYYGGFAICIGERQ